MENRPVLLVSVSKSDSWIKSRTARRQLNYPSGPAVGVEDEERDVGELEERAGAVDGGDEGPAAAVGDPWEAVPEADAAVEQGQQVGEPIELLRRLSLEDPLERRPECHAGRQEQQRIREQFIDRKAGKTRKKEIISVLAWLAYTGDRKRARAKTLPAMANKSEEKHSATQSTKQFRALES